MPLSRHPSNKRASGFTLTELAVVLMIISLLLGGLLIPLGTQQEMDKRRLTAQQLTNIREALVGFTLIHGRLPCPDTTADPTLASYGQEDATCSTGPSEGALPWKTLGVSEYDAWGNHWQSAADTRLGFWRYRIERGYANETTLKTYILRTGDTCSGVNSPFPDDCLQISNSAGQILNAAKERPIVLVYSGGPNLQADGDNANGGNSYQADTPSVGFDDQLIWLTRNSLVTQLIAAGKLP